MAHWRTDQFTRVEQLVGTDSVHQLREATVTVCGLGAVGSFTTEALARSGIGHLRLVDFDVVNESNLNRQLYALHSTIGQPKAILAKKRVLDINPACDVDAVELFIDEKTAPELFAQRPEMAVDAIDSVNPKATLIHAAVEAGIPIISSMGAATRTDPLAVRVDDLFNTQNCPLARMIRKRLRKRGVSKGVPCVYSIEQPRNPISEDFKGDVPREERVVDRGRVRQPMGSICSLPGIFGLTIAREVLFRILKNHRS